MTLPILPDVLRPDPSARTIFLLPGIFGEERTFSDLRDALQERYDTHIVPYPTLTASTRLLTDIDATAAFVASHLLNRSSAEPALIVGYSYGANVAFAVAGRLLAEGRRVALLVLLDPALPTTDFDVHQSGPASDVVGRPLPRVGIMYRSRLLRSALATLCRLAPARTRQRFQRRTLWKLRAYARRAWTPRRIDCRVLHVMTEQFAPAVATGWMELCPDVRQVNIGTRHVNLLDGAALSDVVDRVQRDLSLATRLKREASDGSSRPTPPPVAVQRNGTAKSQARET